ncbi:MAG TPA: ATP-binding protein, partial [Acidimicrobiales bacterium]|nr:ATP-binding protein [Acidimicrobiales bacterium]
EAGDVAALLGKGPPPPRLITDHPGTEVQVVDDRHRVVSSTADLAGRPPVASVLPPAGRQVHLTVHGEADETDPAVALGVRTPEGPRVVYVVGATEAAEDAAHNSLLPLAGLLLVLLGVTGLVAWLLVARALEPVERIRSQVASISGGDLDQRVEEPPVDDEVGRLARTMNAMLARIEASAERQSQFVADASHELRSPLASLLAELEVARRHPESTDWPAVADSALEDGARLQRIVDDLLLLARSDEGHLHARLRPVDLDELAIAEGEELRGRGRVRVDLHRVGAARVHGDADLLRRLLRNLAENAERHAESVVGLEVAAGDGWAELAVTDDGPGIPPERREWVFERFARLDGGRSRQGGGTGLGLSIVREIARAHHGDVRVSDTAASTRLVVRLPAETVRGPAPDGATSGATRDQGDRATPSNVQVSTFGPGR